VSEVSNSGDYHKILFYGEKIADELSALFAIRVARACVHSRKQNYDERCQNKTLTSKPAHALNIPANPKNHSTCLVECDSFFAAD